MYVARYVRSDDIDIYVRGLHSALLAWRAVYYTTIQYIHRADPTWFSGTPVFSKCAHLKLEIQSSFGFLE